MLRVLHGVKTLTLASMGYMGVYAQKHMKCSFCYGSWWVYMGFLRKIGECMHCVSKFGNQKIDRMVPYVGVSWDT